MTPSCRNIFTNIPDQLPEEWVDSILQKDHLRLERIVSKGHVTALGQWYDQSWDEWVLLIQGEATLLFEKGMKRLSMRTGDHIMIPARTKHRVEWTHPEIETIWLAVYYRH